jgi:phage terminase large subunit
VHYKEKQLIEYHAKEIKKRDIYKKKVIENDIQREVECAHRYVDTVADHDAQDNAEINQYKIFTNNADKSDKAANIQKAKNRFKIQGNGKPRLYILKNNNTQILIDELFQYHWIASKEGQNEKEEPVKVFDHAIDAFRYSSYYQISTLARRHQGLSSMLNLIKKQKYNKITNNR